MFGNESQLETRILLVEDEGIIALDLRQRLEGLGYEVTGVAANGADALALAESTKPTLVFMDITIQGPIDGVETAKKLNGVMDVPIVFLTAHTDTGTIQRAKEARPYGYLVKPFDERELASTIEMAVFRHRSEAEARLLQQAIESAGTGIVVATTREPLLPITMCNAAFQRLTGYTASEVLGKSPWFLEGKETDARHSEELRAAIQAQAECQVTLRLHRKDGSAFWNDVSLSAVRNAVGEVTHFIFFHSDATVRKNSEAAMYQARKVEAIGQLAGGVAHDFNNILAVITGYCEMAQRQVDIDHPVRPRLDNILKAANRAADLTRQLLAFSRKQILKPRLLDLNASVADTLKMLSRLIGEDVSINAKPGAGLGTVRADPGQIEQIILNLALNARDAMPGGGVLTIATTNADLDDAFVASHPPAIAGRYVMLSVTDSGAGMSAEVQSRIFEPFFTTKPEGQGTGLGLATVFGIVKQSEGFIWVESELGLGTTFKIYLPRVDGQATTTGAIQRPVDAPRGHETILLVEDTDSLRELVQEQLEQCGYRVMAAPNGREALAAAKSFADPIDLLLTDVVMPHMGGAELATALLESRPAMKVIYMSGYSDGAISRRGILGAGLVLIEKPFKTDLLARTIRDVLDRPAGAPPD